MPEVLLRFLLDLSPKDAKLISVWLESNPIATEQMIRTIGHPTVRIANSNHAYHRSNGIVRRRAAQQ
jgi:hypothetical protein